MHMDIKKVTQEFFTEQQHKEFEHAAIEICYGLDRDVEKTQDAIELIALVYGWDADDIIDLDTHNSVQLLAMIEDGMEFDPDNFQLEGSGPICSGFPHINDEWAGFTGNEEGFRDKVIGRIKAMLYYWWGESTIDAEFAPQARNLTGLDVYLLRDEIPMIDLIDPKTWEATGERISLAHAPVSFAYEVMVSLAKTYTKIWEEGRA